MITQTITIADGEAMNVTDQFNEQFKWPVDVTPTAYIIMETKMIWFWQWRRYERNGWSVSLCPMGWLRFQVERCIG